MPRNNDPNRWYSIPSDGILTGFGVVGNISAVIGVVREPEQFARFVWPISYSEHVIWVEVVILFITKFVSQACLKTSSKGINRQITWISPSPPQSQQKVGLFHDLQRLTTSTAFHKSYQVLRAESAVDRQAEYQERWSISAMSAIYNPHCIKTNHLIDVISSRARQVPFLSKPVSFNLHFEPTLFHWVASEFPKWALW